MLETEVTITKRSDGLRVIYQLDGSASAVIPTELPPDLRGVSEQGIAFELMEEKGRKALGNGEKGIVYNCTKDC